MTIAEPDAGDLACGDVGPGRLASLDRIVAEVQRAAVVLRGRDILHGRRFIITAGGTREPIDDVRWITNRSSGRMGVEIARAAAGAGAEAELVVTTSVDPRLYADIGAAARVQTAEELRIEVLRRSDGADVVVMAAAVSDYTVRRAQGKLERSTATTIELLPTADILAELSARRASNGASGTTPLLVGFAAESGAEGVERARAKLRRKQIDMIVHNDVAREDIGFDSDFNEVTVITAHDEQRLPRARKSTIAVELCRHIADAIAGPRRVDTPDRIVAQ